jgi:hypothetical protein
MIKTMGFSKAKDGVSLAAFKAYYEGVHAPMAVRMLPMIHRYVRNYVQVEGARMPEGADPSEFGWACITEMWFASEADYDAFHEALSRPEIRHPLVGDEDEFVMPNSVWKVVVDEVASAL